METKVTEQAAERELSEAARMWCRVADAVRAGLPAPIVATWVSPHRCFTVRLPDNDMAGADAWIEHIGLPEPSTSEAIGGPGDMFRSYKSSARRHGWDDSGVWSVEVWSAIDEPVAVDGSPSDLDVPLLDSGGCLPCGCLGTASEHTCGDQS